MFDRKPGKRRGRDALRCVSWVNGCCYRSKSMAKMKELDFEEMVNIKPLECHSLPQGIEFSRTRLLYKMMIHDQGGRLVYYSNSCRANPCGSVQWAASQDVIAEEARVGIEIPSVPIIVSVVQELEGNVEGVEEEEEKQVKVVKGCPVDPAEDLLEGDVAVADFLTQLQSRKTSVTLGCDFFPFPLSPSLFQNLPSGFGLCVSLMAVFFWVCLHCL